MSTIDLSVVLVHYRTPELLDRALSALEADFGGCGLRVELVVVDNSGELDEPGEAGRYRLIQPGQNLGFAGAARLAVEGCRADHVVLMNCDVLVQVGCLAGLLDAMKDGADIAGPALFWDEDLKIRLPPSEPRSRLDELGRALTHRLPILARRLRRRRRRLSHQHWSAQEPLESVALSGCLLAFRKHSWNETGGMDDAFKLYFEETDWLLRSQRAGSRIRYVPEAVAVHLYDRSASAEPAAAEWFRQSAERFRRRHYGPLFCGLVELLAAADVEEPTVDAMEQGPRLSIPSAARGGWVEIGAPPHGFPAAATRLSPEQDHWQLPQETWKHLRPGLYTLIIVGTTGVEHGLEFVRKG